MECEVLVLAVPAWRDRLGLVLHRSHHTVTASSPGEARAAIASGCPFDAWIAGVHSVDSEMFSILAEVNCRPPTLVLCESAGSGCVNRAISLGATAAIWPVSSEVVDGFLVHAEASLLQRFNTFTARIKRDYKLSTREASVYRQIVLGSAAKEIAALHGVEPSTIRTQVGEVLRKLHAPDVETLRANSLRSVLGEPRLR